MLWTLASILFFIHYFFDTHYFVRVFIHCFCSRFFFKKIKFLEPSSIYGVCFSTDVDMMLNHMNNSRFLREFDFGRMDYGFRTGVFQDFVRKGGSFLVSGVSVRYRLSLGIFSPYKVVTTPLWWDEKFLYFDQRVVTLTDGIVRCQAFTKICTVISMGEYLKQVAPEVEKPEIPEDLQTWISSQDITRANMKKAN